MLRTNDLDPDGFRIVVPWEAMEIDDSAFVPCINVVRCQRQIDAVGLRLCMTLVTRVVIETQLLGLRVWRTT